MTEGEQRIAAARADDERKKSAIVRLAIGPIIVGVLIANLITAVFVAAGYLLLR